MHRTIMAAFPQSEVKGLRKKLGILYRVETKSMQTAILMQSAILPDVEIIRSKYVGYVEGHTTKDLSPLINRIQDRTRFRFRLLANPVAHLDGKLLPIKSPKAYEQWFYDKASAGGFTVVVMKNTLSTGIARSNCGGNIPIPLECEEPSLNL